MTYKQYLQKSGAMSTPIEHWYTATHGENYFGIFWYKIQFPGSRVSVFVLVTGGSHGRPIVNTRAEVRWGYRKFCCSMNTRPRNGFGVTVYSLGFAVMIFCGKNSCFTRKILVF